MNPYIANITSGAISVAELPDWALSHGINALSTKEVMHLCAIPAQHISQRMALLQKRNQMFSPARGLWIPIPAEYRTWGAPDPFVYIDAMMAHLGIDYLVGWLSAAARHGASHHASQVFQVATTRMVRERTLGRSRLEFFTRNYVGKVAPTQKFAQNTRAKIASVETTMLMVASDVGICGGINNVANVIVELADEHNNLGDRLVNEASLFPDAASRRVGWLLDTFGNGAPDSLREYCLELKSNSSLLSPTAPKSGKTASGWKIIINEEVDPDI